MLPLASGRGFCLPKTGLWTIPAVRRWGRFLPASPRLCWRAISAKMRPLSASNITRDFGKMGDFFALRGRSQHSYDRLTDFRLEFIFTLELFLGRGFQPRAQTAGDMASSVTRYPVSGKCDVGFIHRNLFLWPWGIDAALHRSPLLATWLKLTAHEVCVARLGAHVPLAMTETTMS